MTNLSKALEGLWAGQYGSTAQQTRLKPQLFFGRYLVVASVASRNIGVYDVKSGQKMAMIAGIPQADLLEDVLLSVDRRHVIQLNSDGQFFLHEIATGRMALSGRYVDGEIILYTPEAYYWSSYEGAHFVSCGFPACRASIPSNNLRPCSTVPRRSRPGWRGRTLPPLRGSCRHLSWKPGSSKGRPAAAGASRCGRAPAKGWRTSVSTRMASH